MDAVGHIVSNAAVIGVPEFALDSKLYLADTHSPEYEADLKRSHTLLIYNLVNDIEALLKKDSSVEEEEEDVEDPFLA